MYCKGVLVHTCCVHISRCVQVERDTCMGIGVGRLQSPPPPPPPPQNHFHAWGGRKSWVCASKCVEMCEPRGRMGSQLCWALCGWGGINWGECQFGEWCVWGSMPVLLSWRVCVCVRACVCMRARARVYARMCERRREIELRECVNWLRGRVWIA